MSCSALNSVTEYAEDRVGQFADAKPGCACEQESLTELSPGVIDSAEMIVRVVCAPMHVHRKRLELNSSFFSHVNTRGLSVQRLEHSKDEELVSCVEGLLSRAQDGVWLGYVQAPAAAIRQVRMGEEQGFCVADAALADNRAHAEIHSSKRIPEADHVEYRVELMRVFNAGGIRGRRSLRNSNVWDALDQPYRDRTMPAHWGALA